MARILVTALLVILASTFAQAKVFITDDAQKADVVIYLIAVPEEADCKLLHRDLTREDQFSEIWATISQFPDDADKWVFLTQDDEVADDIWCLVED